MNSAAGRSAAVAHPDRVWVLTPTPPEATAVPTIVDPLVRLITLCPAVAAALSSVAEVLLGVLDRGDRVDAAEEQIVAATDGLASAGLAEVLRRHEPTADVVEVEGRLYRRMSAPSKGTYFGLRGPIELERHLFREVAVRNGPTIVPLELNAGLVDGQWTPPAAAAAGRLMQEMPSRDAAQLCRALKVMPYSRSSLERVTCRVGARWEEIRADAEAELIDGFEVPEEAAAVTVSVDRVALPMEEALLDDAGEPVLDLSTGRERLRAAYRMAYCGVWTLHDAEGEPLHSVRYGRLPQEGHGPIEETLWSDLFALKLKKPALKVVGLADGAPEMQLMLDRTAGLFEESSTIGLDYWHVIEKLAAAIKATERASSEWLPKFKAFLRTDERGAERVLMTLESWRVAHGDERDPPEALTAAITYVKGNVDRMRYKRLLDQGLPIGSGHVEATCKTLVSTRMKRSGARWKVPGGQAILSLRALAKSSRWEDAMALLLPTWTQPVREVA